MSDRITTDPATTRTDLEGDTEVGSVFVSNYPAYSFWNGEDLADYTMADGTKLQVDVQTSDWLTKGLKVGDEVSWTPHPDRAMVFSADDPIEKESV